MSAASSSFFKLNLLSADANVRTLHFTWVAFFISIFVWFTHAPLMATIRDALMLSDQEVKTILILNVALTIPARIIVGMLVDRFGPRMMYSALLAISGVLCLLFATANDFETLAITRFLLGFAGAGFVVGIRMIGEWFPAQQVGLAEGIYGGWGNFGAAAAAITLPTTALLLGGEDGWRYAVAIAGVVALLYAGLYYRSVRDTPKGSTYFKPSKSGAMEITNKRDFFLYMIMKAPLFMALALLTWKLGPVNFGMLSQLVAILIYAGLSALYLYQVFHIWEVNKSVFTEPVPHIHRYKFKQVAVLDLAYMVTFGSELAMVSMLPLFFQDTFGLSLVGAGLLASSFAFTNLFARPGGGVLSDRFGRKISLVVSLAGAAAGYFLMSKIDSHWGVPFAIAATMTCSIFVQAGSGAVFAMVPLVKRRLTGQVAGMVGAYGSVGAVVFLTVLSFVAPQVFFLVIAGTAVVTVVAIQLVMDEPEGQTAEVLPDGTVQMIDVT